MGDAIQVWDESMFEQVPEFEWVEGTPDVVLALYAAAVSGEGCDRRPWEPPARTYFMAETVEKHTRYTTVVDDLPSAWEFVMKKIDLLGQDPAIEILPTWALLGEGADAEPVRQFSVTVSGVTEDDDG